MARRRRTVTTKCAHDGCNEWAHFEADNAKDEERIRRSEVGKWKCVRHYAANEVLSKDNRTTTVRLVAGKSKKYPELKDLFWGDGSGFTHGDGYKAFAKDFPEGTVLEVTARIILPSATTEKP